MSWLKTHNRSRIVFDPQPIDMSDVEYKEYDWTGFYADAEEPIPPNAPEPRGKAVQTTMFVDADHAGNKVTRRSRTGVLIFVMRAPVLWYSKAQGGIETSSFGSEFMGLKTGTELLQGLRYKLRMMGVPLDGPSHVRVDNQSVVKNTTAPESQLKKKSNSIAYHFVREQVAARVMRIAYEKSDSNLADCLTKIMSGMKRLNIVKHFLK
jgi:hypothetical protein